MAAGGEEKRRNVLRRTPPNPPRLSPYKRIRASSGSTALSSPLQLLKKTRYAPDLLRCHSCDLRFPSHTNNPLDSLCSLRSQWRVALLCRDCLARVRSAGLCSYCFSQVSDDSVSCLRCSCRVHVGCVDREHRWVSPWRLEPGSFTCVDCCAIPKFWGRSPEIGSAVSLEEVVKEANSVTGDKAGSAPRSKENAAEKAAVAKRAANRSGSNAPGAVLVAKGDIPKQDAGLAPVRDEELALRLHLAMNGSRRITRNLIPLSFGGTSAVRKVCRSSGHLTCTDADLQGRKITKTCKISKKVEVCTKNKTPVGKMGTAMFKAADSRSVRNDDNRSVDENAKEGSADIPLREDCGSCSDKVSSSGDDQSTESTTSKCEGDNESEDGLLPSTCQGGAMEKSSEIPRNSNIITDRYFKKYFKRKSRHKGLVDSQLVSQLPSSYISVPKT